MSKAFSKVVLLQGGDSPEREVSLTSAKNVEQSLLRLCDEVVCFDPAEKNIAELKDIAPDIVFNILHGGAGEDGRIQATLNQMGLKVTGSNYYASALAMDKNLCKLIWASEELPTPSWLLVNDTNQDTLDAVLLELGNEVFVKPNNGGSSIATTKVTNRQELEDAIKQAQQAGNKDILVEQTISGMELTYSIVGQKVLPGIRIEVSDGFYDYAAKYEKETTRYISPPQIEQSIDKECQELALKAFKAIGCYGWGRVDFMVNGREPLLLEINTIPGMTSHSLVPKAANAAGIEFDQLITQILELAQ